MYVFFTAFLVGYVLKTQNGESIVYYVAPLLLVKVTDYPCSLIIYGLQCFQASFTYQEQSIVGG